MKTVPLLKLADAFQLINMLPEVSLTGREITSSAINRPALQLTGYFEHFDSTRIQIIGYVEYSYLMHLELDERIRAFDDFASHDIPLIIFTTMTMPGEELLEVCRKHKVPVLRTDRTTSDFSAALIRWLRIELTASISIHGVLIDVYGEGVLITGESGIGKSEAALELIKRGHRLVSDDVVELSRISDAVLIGEAPDITRHLMELRGIGIIDVKTLFGIESVENTKTIDMVIKLEEWDRDKEYDRLGLEEQFTEYLGNRVECYAIPVRPGRNLAVIIETAAVNHRQKRMGYNAAKELYKRVQENLSKNRK